MTTIDVVTHMHCAGSRIAGTGINTLTPVPGSPEDCPHCAEKTVAVVDITITPQAAERMKAILREGIKAREAIPARLEALLDLLDKSGLLVPSQFDLLDQAFALLEADNARAIREMRAAVDGEG